jgi:hypothetical protein
MPTITVTKRWRNTDNKSGTSSTYISQVSANVNTPKDAVIPFPEPLELQYHFTKTPSVDDYFVTYGAVYGKQPKVMILEFDENDDLLELYLPPRRVMTDGVLTQLIWDFDLERSGLIVISK